ncbi:MAG: rhomboid family intramembrane serine protease [Rhodospirillales bacterium]
MIPFRTTAPAAASPVVTMALIVANIAVFFFQQGLSPDALAAFVRAYALVPIVYGRPDLALAAGLDQDNYLPFLTSTFLHGGYPHLILNLWTLWLFGTPLEGRLGGLPFLFFYLLAGAAGGLCHVLFNWHSAVPALGASGAVAGVLGGFTWLFPKAKVALVQPIFVLPVIFHLPAFLFTALWFALQLWRGTAELAAAAGAGVAWWAHVGGFAAGLALAVWFRAGKGGRRGPWG